MSDIERKDIVAQLEELAIDLRIGDTISTEDEMADLLGKAAIEIERLRKGLAEAQKYYGDEVDEFNAGYAAYEAGLLLASEPSDTPHDQWRVGWAWAKFNAENVTDRA